MKNTYKKPAVDLTDLAIGIVVLGIVVSIGTVVLVTLRDSRLTDIPQILTANETITPGYTTGATLSNSWVNNAFEVINESDASEAVPTADYTLTVGGEGSGQIVLTSSSDYANQSINVSYNWYNTSANADWTLANNASIGLGEYGNWFKIIVIVGVAAVVLSLIFMAFGRRSGEGDVGVSY